MAFRGFGPATTTPHPRVRDEQEEEDDDDDVVETPPQYGPNIEDYAGSGGDDDDDDDDDEDVQEIDAEEFDHQASHESPPRKTKQQPSGKSSAEADVVIPSNGFAPAFHARVLALLCARNPLPHPIATHFAHLNCFQLTPWHGSEIGAAGSILDFKQHAQALCLLLKLMQPSEDQELWPNVAADPPFPSQFDFLNNLNDPYPGSLPESRAVLKEGHRQPLRGLSNTIESGAAPLDHIEQLTKAELLLNANKLLTRIDHVYSATGGILSIPPPPPPSSNESHDTGLVHNSILAQWLGHTRALTLRLASLEKETAALREVLGHEAIVAGVRGKQSRERTSNGDGCGERDLVYPQDRYVLAGLSDGLWARLHEELSVQEGENEQEQEHEREEREQGRGVQERGWGDFGAAEADGAGETKVVTWIETMSRLYRIRGHETIFVIPGFGLHPGAPAVHRVERTPLVQTMPERRVINGDYVNVGATAWERDMIAGAKERDAKILVLEAAIKQLKRELETEKAGRRRLVEDAELRGRRTATPVREGDRRGGGGGGEVRRLPVG